MSKELVSETDNIAIYSRRTNIAGTVGTVFDIHHEGELKHPNCSAEDALIAVSHYLSVAESDNKLLKKRLQLA